MSGFVPPTLGSETIFHLGSFEVRNTIITSVITVLFLLVIGLILRRKDTLLSGGFQNLVETLVEGLFNF